MFPTITSYLSPPPTAQCLISVPCDTYHACFNTRGYSSTSFLQVALLCWNPLHFQTHKPPTFPLRWKFFPSLHPLGQIKLLPSSYIKIFFRQSPYGPAQPSPRPPTHITLNSLCDCRPNSVRAESGSYSSSDSWHRAGPNQHIGTEEKCDGWLRDRMHRALGGLPATLSSCSASASFS